MTHISFFFIFVFTYLQGPDPVIPRKTAGEDSTPLGHAKMHRVATPHHRHQASTCAPISGATRALQKGDSRRTLVHSGAEDDDERLIHTKHTTITVRIRTNQHHQLKAF